MFANIKINNFEKLSALRIINISTEYLYLRCLSNVYVYLVQKYLCFRRLYKQINIARLCINFKRMKKNICTFTVLHYF